MKKGLILAVILIIVFGGALAYFFIGSPDNGGDIYDGGLKRNYCPETRGEICIQIYDPVCGWNSDGVIRTYSNDCVACSDRNVLYWTAGECPNN